MSEPGRKKSELLYGNSSCYSESSGEGKFVYTNYIIIGRIGGFGRLNTVGKV